MNKTKAHKIKVGILGTGYIAETHAAILKGIPDILLQSCCDISHPAAESFVKKWGIPEIYTSIGQLLTQSQPNVLHILTTPDTHYPLAEAALRHKVNVFIEKPLSPSSQECRDLVDFAQNHACKVGVNHNATFHPAFLKLLNDFCSNRFGHISRIIVNQTLPLRQLESGRFSAWMFRKPENIIFEQAPHPLSQIQKLLGPLLSAEVTAEGKIELSPGQFFYTVWHITARCERSFAYLHFTFHNRCFPQNTVLVSGQDGTAFLDLLRNIYLVQDKTAAPEYLEPTVNALRYGHCVGQGIENFLNYVLSKVKLTPRADTFYESMKNSIEAFYNAILSNTELPNSGKEGVFVIEACEKIIGKANLCSNYQPKVIPEVRTASKPEILVTGANGFIGSCLVQKLISQGKRVRVLVRSRQGLKQTLWSDLVEVVTGDVTEEKSVQDALDGIKYIYHLAHGGSGNWESFYKTNVLATESIAKASLNAGVKYFIYTSTIATYYYGRFQRGSQITEKDPIDDRPEKRALYARSKIIAEGRLNQLHTQEGLPLVMFRPGVVVGKHGSLYHSGVGQWVRDNVCDYWGEGSSPLPFVLADDVANALATVVEKEGLAGETFNLTGDVLLTAREYINELCRYSSRNIIAKPYPVYFMFVSEAGKYFLKRFLGRDNSALLSYRDLRTRDISVIFECVKAKIVLSWRPCNNRSEFIQKALGWAFEENNVLI